MLAQKQCNMTCRYIHAWWPNSQLRASRHTGVETPNTLHPIKMHSSLPNTTCVHLRTNCTSGVGLTGQPVMQAASNMTSDSEGERASKQRFFQQLEADWQVTHSGEPIDYALLNRMHSSSMGPESSSSPDRSPVKRSSTELGRTPVYQGTNSCTFLWTKHLQQVLSEHKETASNHL